MECPTGSIMSSFIAGTELNFSMGIGSHLDGKRGANVWPIFPLVGEMPGRAEGGASQNDDALEEPHPRCGRKTYPFHRKNTVASGGSTTCMENAFPCAGARSVHASVCPRLDPP
ncbi:Hypothetical protein NGAL_HAMBI2605_39010 [Neorhizobium galegae bv. orientalis]|nr:Hypothetical protein NGAL_HAMBI2605_39010 [Neorhizobium galegae bv. orientalis]